MVAGSFTEDTTVALPAELLWKVAFADAEARSMVVAKACAGYIEAIEVEGDGGPGTITTVKLNPSVAEIKTLKSRTVAFDGAARVLKKEVLQLQDDALSVRLKTQVIDFKVEAAGEGACVFKMKVDYERHDSAALAPEDQAKVSLRYISLIKMVEAYLIAHPNEFA